MEVVDLHLHSTASDGEATPHDVARGAARAGISAIALTDHDTVAGIAEAIAAGAESRLRVVAGCEFSVAAWWGELHLLGYFLPTDDPELGQLFETQRSNRLGRAAEIVERLTGMGVTISLDSVTTQAGHAPIGRPHIARALVNSGEVASINEAFGRYLADGAPACVPKSLPDLQSVASLVRRLGGVTSAAHLKSRATLKTLRRLQQAGVDAVEVLHPAHDDDTVSRVQAYAQELGMLKTGGSDWHGDSALLDRRRVLGAQRVPVDWLDELERLHLERTNS